MGVKKRWLLALLALLGALVLVVAGLGLRLQRAAAAPVDAVLVLGGSIQREIYVAEARWPEPRPPILISQGSPDPCIRLLFERAGSPLTGVWLEKCADSTFENFLLALPVLRRWQTRHVRVITSGSHLLRAAWVGRIVLGSQGIWSEVVAAPETGVPGNLESAPKTMLDVGRSLLWVAVSPLYRPRCSQVIELAAVDVQRWRQQGFRCEHQGGLS